MSKQQYINVFLLLFFGMQDSMLLHHFHIVSLAFPIHSYNVPISKFLSSSFVRFHFSTSIFFLQIKIIGILLLQFNYKFFVDG